MVSHLAPRCLTFEATEEGAYEGFNLITHTCVPWNSANFATTKARGIACTHTLFPSQGNARGNT